MDFEISINGETQTFEQFHEMLSFFTQKAAYWNNFEPHMGLHVHLEKVKSETDTIGVNAADEFQISEHIS